MSVLKEGVGGAFDHADDAIESAATDPALKAKLRAAMPRIGGSPVPKIVDVYRVLAPDVATLEGDAFLALMAAAKLISDNAWFGLGEEATNLYYANEHRLPAPPPVVAGPTPGPVPPTPPSPPGDAP